MKIIKVITFKKQKTQIVDIGDIFAIKFELFYKIRTD